MWKGAGRLIEKDKSLLRLRASSETNVFGTPRQSSRGPNAFLLLNSERA